MNFRAVKAIYRFEMARMFRTVVQSIVAPVLSTSLYFVIFGSAIGSRIAEIDGVRIIGTAELKCSILSFMLDQHHPTDVGTILNYQGVAIRTGHHCAMPVMQHYGVPGTARASFAMYNTREDVDSFIEALKKARDMLS